MTPADLLAEQFDHGTADDRIPVVLAEWTAAEQVQHIADALEVTREWAAKLLAQSRGGPRPRTAGPRKPRPRNLPSDPPGQPHFANREKPSVRHAKGTTLEELLQAW
jgi:hypothetical protein